MDAQTYAVNFESMRKPLRGASQKQQILVVHKELNRQCQAIVARHRSDTRIVTSEIRRQQQSLRDRIERLDRDRDRFRRDARRVDRYLTETARGHELAEREAAMVDGRLAGKVKSTGERNEEARAEGVSLMRFVDRLAMPPETKKRIHDEILLMYGDLWD